MKPTNLQELSDAIASSESVRIVGQGTRTKWGSQGSGDILDMAGLCGIVDLSPHDQVVSVWAGTPIYEIQRALEPHRQCLPIVSWTGDRFDHREIAGSAGGELSLDLPHPLQAQCGSWRDWVLGMTLVMADGTLCKSGSHAVKNVAGYDVHKLMVGARGTLAVVAQVILRTYPLESLPAVATAVRGNPAQEINWMQRVLRADFTAATDMPGDGWDDLEGNTIYRVLPQGGTPKRFPDDRVWQHGPPEIPDNHLRKLMTRTKLLFDPGGKLNLTEFDLDWK